ncbi:MAG: hypothetical protein ACOX88_00845 [Christensenellales bacterium]
MSYAKEESNQSELLQSKADQNIIDFFEEHRDVMPDTLDLTLSFGTFLTVYLLVTLTAVLSVFIANIRTLLMPPKKVLAQSG